jgi:hypothetical protein
MFEAAIPGFFPDRFNTEADAMKGSGANSFEDSVKVVSLTDW